MFYSQIKYLLSLYFGLFFLEIVYSQSASKPVSQHIESYTDKLTIYTFGVSKFSSFEIKQAGQKQDSVLRFSPNSNFNIGFGLSYNWLSIATSFKFGFINNDQNRKGKTSSFDILLDIFSKRMVFNANVQHYKGYYWKNPEMLFPNWNIEDSVVIRPDISTITLGLKGIYIFNHTKFSVKAAYQYSERQIKSAGSMLLGSRFSLYGLNADSSIVPLQLNDKYANLNNIGSLSSISFGASFGYTYTLVFGKYFYVNSLLMTGLNVQSLVTNTFNDEKLSSDIKLSTNITFRTALGFNKPKVYYGISFMRDTFLLRNSNRTELTYSYGKFYVYYGIRFG